MDTKFYTLKELAALLKVSTRTVERAVARGELQCVHIGRAIRFPVSEVERLVKGV